MTARRPLVLAAVAAAAATAGDVILLRAGAGAPVATNTLAAGSLVGVLAIPVYALGYRAVAAACPPPLARSLVAGGGAVAGVLGGAIHGMTGLGVHLARLAGATPLAPADFVTRHGAVLLRLWVLAALATVVASAASVWSRIAGGPRVSGAGAVCTPAVVTMALVGATLAHPVPWATELLAPAAPNLAHLIFFGVAARAARA
jgi:hypothetical protein